MPTQRRRQPSACEANSRSGHAGQSPRSLTPRATGLPRRYMLTFARMRGNLVAKGAQKTADEPLKNLLNRFEGFINDK